MVYFSGSSTLPTYAVMSVTSMAYSSSHSCGEGAQRWQVGGVPVGPRPRDVRQVELEGRQVLDGALAGFVAGMVALQGVGQVCPGRPLAGWGSWEGILRAGLAGVRGVACCGLGLWGGEVHMLFRVLRVLELQL